MHNDGVSGNIRNLHQSAGGAHPSPGHGHHQHGVGEGGGAGGEVPSPDPELNISKWERSFSPASAGQFLNSFSFVSDLWIIF